MCDEQEEARLANAAQRAGIVIAEVIQEVQWYLRQGAEPVRFDW